MRTNDYIQGPGKKLQAVYLPAQDDGTRRQGNFRAVLLKARNVKADRLWGTQKAASDSYERSFSKTPFDLQLEADRNAYEPRILH